MTAHPSLTDAALREMLVRRASRARPYGLHDAIMATVATTAQLRRPWISRPGWMVVPPPERRLLWAIALVGLLLLAAATAMVGSRLLDRARELPLGPSELVPSGIEILSPGLPVYDQAGVDGEGIVWAIAPSGLTRYDPAGATARTWSVEDDLRFVATGMTAAQAGGVWLINGPMLRRFDGTAFREEVDVGANVTVATEAPDASLWAATIDGTLVHLVGSSRLSTDAPNPRPEGGISAIAVDATGVVWCGWNDFASVAPTPSSVSRFDGSAWRFFDSSDVPLLEASINTIATLPDGSVWVATAAGIARFDGSAWSEVTVDRGALANIASLAVDASGGMWAAAAAQDGGAVSVARLAGGSWTLFGPPDGLPGPDQQGSPSAWVLPSSERILVGTGAGLYELRGDRWQHAWPVATPPGPAPFEGGVQRLIALSGDEAWVGDLSGEVWHYAANGWSSVPPLGSRINDLLRTDDGTLWACARFSGRYRLQGTTWTVATVGDSGCAMATDATGALWVVEPSSGGPEWTLRSYAYDGRTWTERTRTPPTDLVSGPERVAITRDGAIWVGAGGIWGSGGGLVRYLDGTWEMVSPRGTETRFGVGDLVVAPNGDVWVAGQDEQTGTDVIGQTWVGRFDGTRWTTYERGEILPLSDPFAQPYVAIGDLAAAPDGTIWAATSDGLARFDGVGWTTRYPGIWFGAVSAAPDGTIWIDGTHGIGRLTTSASAP